MVQDNQEGNPPADYSFLGDDPNISNDSSLMGKLTNANKKTRILIVASGAGVLLVLVSLFAALIFGGSNDTTQNFIGLAQRQQEIIRIADIGAQHARNQETRSAAITARTAITSSQQRVVNNVASKGIQLRRADVEIRENPQTTKELATANQANRFDETFIKILQSELREYQSSVELTATHIGGTDLELLRSLNDEINVLLDALDRIDIEE